MFQELKAQRADLQRRDSSYLAPLITPPNQTPSGILLFVGVISHRNPVVALETNSSLQHRLNLMIICPSRPRLTAIWLFLQVVLGASQCLPKTLLRGILNKSPEFSNVGDDPNPELSISRPSPPPNPHL